MLIEVFEDGSIKWRFFRRSYKKARWKREGARKLRYFQKHFLDGSGMIGVI